MASHSTTSPSGSIGLFCKAPVPGRVKTRLARRLGEEMAAEIADAFLQDSLAAVTRWAPGRVVVAVAPDGFQLDGVECLDQGPGDLGARLERVAATLLRRARWVLLLGSDCPGLPASHLDEAAAELEAGAPAVIGPADDGGFWALGLRQPVALANIRWSSPETCEDTIRQLDRQGLSATILSRWYDVDHHDDLLRLAEDLRAGQIDAPATRRLLGERLGLL